MMRSTTESAAINREINLIFLRHPFPYYAREGCFLVSVVLLLIQMTVTVIVGVYFYRQLKGQPRSDGSMPHSSLGHREMDKLGRLRRISLTQPLSEQVRPRDFSDIIGQEEGIKALKAVLCSPNPQHVIIYGPPGIGKTCAARLVLEEARKT